MIDEIEMEQEEAPKKTGGIFATLAGLVGMGGVGFFGLKGGTRKALETVAFDTQSDFAKKVLAEDHAVGKAINELKGAAEAPVDVLGSIQDHVRTSKLSNAMDAVTRVYEKELAELTKEGAGAKKIKALGVDFESTKKVLNNTKGAYQVEETAKTVENNLKKLGEKLGKMDQAKLAWGGMSGTRKGVVIGATVVSLGLLGYGVSRVMGKHTQKVEADRAAAAQQGMQPGMSPA